MKLTRIYFIIFILLFGIGCQNTDLKGLSLSEDSGGVRVVFDLYATPVPDIPFPIDIATKPDPDSPTNLRLNFSLDAPTDMEKRVRRLINTLDGFGTYSPITVSFTGSLDVEDIKKRHSNLDWTDDAIYVFNIDEDSPHFGEAVKLDLGNGNFPVTLEKNNNYFANDPRKDGSNLVFETYNEDKNGNGVLDFGEDTDGDGILDRPNLFPGAADPYDDLVDFFDFQTNTLIIRPIVPLQECSKYAVVLTKRLYGADGRPVVSPFKYINHIWQTDELRPLLRVLPKYGLDISVVAFTWAFTTQCVSNDLVAIREGLYGYGPFSELSLWFSPVVSGLIKLTDDSYVLSAKKLTNIANTIAALIAPDMSEGIKALMDSYKYVDYLAMFSFDSPDFITLSADQVFQINPKTGLIDALSTGEIYAFMAVPKRHSGYKPPFPVVIYSHGYTSNKIEMIGFAGFMAKYGIATVAIDAYHHGMDIKDLVGSNYDTVKDLAKSLGISGFMDALELGRAVDLNGDGKIDSGGDYWTADTFRTRDMVRQTTVDYMQLIRVLSNFCTYHWEYDTDGDGHRDIAGDFDGDGVCDAGGPENRYYIWGESLGGIQSMILPAVEPRVIAAAPTSGGGGLLDIGIRSKQGGVVEAVFLQIMGPIIAGIPDGDGNIVFEFITNDVNKEAKVPFFRIEAAEIKDKIIRVTNLKNNKVDSILVKDDGSFRLQIPSDRGDGLVIEIIDPDSQEVLKKIDTFGMDVEFQTDTYAKGDPLVAIQEGFGIKRQTPDMRRFMGLAQMILEKGDPINYARRYFLEPLFIRPEGRVTSNVLIINTIGDMNVPINTGIAQARAAGLIDYLHIDGRYGTSQNDFLIKNYVLEALEKLKRFDNREILFDPDDLDQNTDGFDAPSPDVPLRLTINTPTGVSAVRFPYISPQGAHGFAIPEPDRAFDVQTFMANMVGIYLSSGGRVIKEDLCMQDNSCRYIPKPLEDEK